MDVLVVILDPTMKNAEKTAGGKLYEYLRFRKPILGLVPENGEAAKVIKMTNSGNVCSNMDGKTIAESEQTSVVYGMPKAAVKRGAARLVIPNYEIKEHIMKFARRKEINMPN